MTSNNLTKTDFVKKKENFVKKIKKIIKFDKIHPFLDKINPYKENQIDEEINQFVDKSSIRRYREIAQWVIDIHLNGLVGGFVLWQIFNLPFNYPYFIALGLGMWMIYKIFGDLKTGIRDIRR